ncbi:MAG: hypothetical protein IT356_12505 [Gemmatimonadaceae bacterium]|nr:hypothetical protein [Gemmatimonadaceae bacterium]
MSAVYVGLHRGGGFIGWLIRLVTRSRVGHASILFGSTVFQASMRQGWGWTTIDRLRGPVTWYRLDVTPEQELSMRRWCEAHVGWAYDWRSVIKFTLLWRLFFNSREARRDQRRLFCFEGVYLCALEGAGIVLLGEARAWEIAGHVLAYSNLLARAEPGL